MKKLFTPKPQKLRNNDSQVVSILTSPLFVVGLVVVCFGILTPKIFMPLFMQIFGFNKQEPKPIINNFDPRMRSGRQTLSYRIKFRIIFLYQFNSIIYIKVIPTVILEAVHNLVVHSQDLYMLRAQLAKQLHHQAKEGFFHSYCLYTPSVLQFIWFTLYSKCLKKRSPKKKLTVTMTK